MQNIIDLLTNDKDINKYFDILNKFNVYERENIAIKSKTMALYVYDEVDELKKDEEKLLSDVVNNKKLSELNILNLGCGGRKINESLIPVDFTRDLKELDMNGHLNNSIISDVNNLIFLNETIDGIIALHIWEHCEDPVKTLNEWLRVLKPGGRIGIVLPNFMYCWSASNDNFKYGHKWNTEPNIVLKLLNEHFKDIKIIKFNTLKYKLSFDIVLEKPGIYIKNNINFKSGYDLDKGQNLEIGYYYHNNVLFT